MKAWDDLSETGLLYVHPGFALLTLPDMSQTTALKAPGFVRITPHMAGVKAA